MELTIDNGKCEYSIEFTGGHVLSKETIFEPMHYTEIEIEEVVFLSGDKEYFDTLEYDTFYNDIEREGE